MWPDNGIRIHAEASTHKHESAHQSQDHGATRSCMMQHAVCCCCQKCPHTHLLRLDTLVTFFFCRCRWWTLAPGRRLSVGPVHSLLHVNHGYRWEVEETTAAECGRICMHCSSHAWTSCPGRRVLNTRGHVNSSKLSQQVEGAVSEDDATSTDNAYCVI